MCYLEDFHVLFQTLIVRNSSDHGEALTFFEAFLHEIH